ncbi:MAG: hypothetical protein HQK65_00315 [Desulfamplus sp.]|nr:hypothetical protein [Desulfamplus sp.]
MTEEIKKDLEKLEKKGFYEGNIDFVSYKEKTKTNKIKWSALASPWSEWDKNNSLDNSWKKPPIGKNKEELKEIREEKPFQVEQLDIKDKETGKKEVRWTVWSPSNSLTNNEVELYSVMRAEFHYINKKYRKLHSHYNGSKGIDSFFVKQGQEKYIICESKFTRDQDEFEKIKNNPSLIKNKLDSYTINKQNVRQMSWHWIKDRAKKAAKKPGEKISQKNIETLKMISTMRQKIFMEKIQRVVNIYGAKKVPMYPGKYKLLFNLKISKKNLHLTWDLKIDDKEFIDLDEIFDVRMKKTI